MKRSHAYALSTASALLAVWPAQSWAQTIKPGLWEITTQVQGAAGSKVDAAMAEMQKQMANMPPEQRKMVEDMMARQGVKVGAAAGGGVQMQMCVTPAMAERNEIGTRQQGDCKQTRSPRSGNTIKFAFECANPPSKGEGQVTINSAESYAITMTSTSMVQGRPEAMSVQGGGRWLSSACGNVKPIDATP